MTIELKIILDALVNYIPILSITVILAGFIKLYLYFKYFSIAIIDYIEWSEIISLSIDNIISFFLLFAYSLINSYLLLPDILPNNFIPNPIQIMFPSIITRWYYYFGLISISVFLFIIYKARRHIYFYEILTIILSIWLIIPFIISKVIIKYMTQPNFDIITTILVFASISLILYVISACYNELYKITNKKYYSNYEFTHIKDTKSKIIQANYIGKTKSYYFFRNPKTHNITIYPASEIKKIKIYLNK